MTQSDQEVMSLAPSSERSFISQSAPTLTATTEVNDAQAVVLGVVSTTSGPELQGSQAVADNFAEELQRQLASLGVHGGADEVVRVPAPAELGCDVVALAGLGSLQAPAQGTPTDDTSETGEISAEALRRAAGAAVRQLAGLESVTLALPADSESRLAAVAEGAAIAAYSYTSFRSTSTEVNAAQQQAADADGATESESAGTLRAPVQNLSFVTGVKTATAQTVLDRASTVAEAVRVTRDLVNTPPSHLFPGSLADTVTDLVKDLNIEATVWDEEQLAAEGFGGILGVGQGSSRPPRLVKLAYAPQEAAAHIALVGKGITFDTGGISLKPAASMMTMKSDMTGAATVAAVLAAVARLGLPVRVTGWLAVAENMPSATSIRPSDVLTMYNGKSVEVMNTDAEGRVVMADALVAACHETPDAVIDIATLTGAQMVALGSRTTGVMGDEALRGELVTAADTAGEAIWPMPIPANQRASLDSSVADMTNMGDRFGGMLTAAAFLREFVGETPWAHLDIAGPSFNESGAWGYTPKDATGVMVRSLIGFLTARARS